MMTVVRKDKSEFDIDLNSEIKLLRAEVMSGDWSGVGEGFGLVPEVLCA